MANRETSWLEGRKEVERSELFYPRDHPYPDGGGGERFLEQRLIYRFPVPIKPTFPRVGTFQRCKIPDKSVFR